MGEKWLYEIQIEGHLSERWWWNLSVEYRQTSSGKVITVLTGTLDRAALRGIVMELFNFDLKLISVMRVEEIPDAQT